MSAVTKKLSADGTDEQNLVLAYRWEWDTGVQTAKRCHGKFQLNTVLDQLSYCRTGSSFLFPAIPSSDECIRSKGSAEIEACGTDGAECARGLRCADDLMASDYASGCLTSENVDNWLCYESRFACYQDLVGQPAALALVRCVTDSGCLPRPLGGLCALPECTSAPPDSACVTCVEQTCLSSTCQRDCYTAYACIETCRKDSCDAEKTTSCQLRCTKQTELEESISEVYECIEQSCKAECCP